MLNIKYHDSMENKQNSNEQPQPTQVKQPQTTTQNEKGCLRYSLIALAVFIIIVIIANIGGTNNGSDKSAIDSTIVDSAYADTTLCADSASAVSNSDVSVDGGKTWDYDTSVDEMNDSKSRFASLTSDNSEYFDFPYNGGSYLKLTVRYTKKWGTDVYVSISKGQFNCNEYDGTDYVRVRFDNGKAIKFRTTEPSDGSSDMLFLSNSKKFITLAKKAKRILVEAPFYQEGNRVFTFTVDKSLEW